MSKKLYNSCKRALTDYLGLKGTESLLIISDEKKREIGNTLFQVGQTISSNCLYIEIPLMKINGEEPPSNVADLMKKYDVVVAPLSKSITHTKARIEASKGGTRIATMPGITEDILARCLSADATNLAERNSSILKLMNKAKLIRIVTKKGTDISFQRGNRIALSSTGILKKKGDSGNLPSGEVYFAPMEGKSNGMIVFDGSIAGIGMVDADVKVTVENGYITNIKGGKSAKQFRENLENVGGDALAVAELGIGTNDKAKIIGQILEDEKVFGTIHIAFGANKSFGGNIQVPLHIDGLVKKPDVYFDNKIIMQSGKLLI